MFMPCKLLCAIYDTATGYPSTVMRFMGRLEGSEPPAPHVSSEDPVTRHATFWNENCLTPPFACTLWSFLFNNFTFHLCITQGNRFFRERKYRQLYKTSQRYIFKSDTWPMKSIDIRFATSINSMVLAMFERLALFFLIPKPCKKGWAFKLYE